ncbi:co-chaperone GroES [candidate division KSB1 bacterium]|nr:co-chaperone GroES [candidate division KSB1 bacterium]
MRIIPIDDRVVVKPLEEEKRKVGNIIIPDTAKEKPQMGDVVAVGNDEELKEVVKKGDRIIYAKYGGTDVEIGGEKYLIVKRDDILGIVEE